MEPTDFALLVVRLWAGGVMIAHGANHARSLQGTANWFASVGFSAPRFNALLSAVNELAIGFALIFGLLTAPAAAGSAATMLVAFWAIHRFAGFFVFHRPDEGYEYVVTLIVVALALAMLGPGAISVDAVIGIDETLNGWVGAGIFVGGLAAGAGLLAAFWRRPETEKDES